MRKAIFALLAGLLLCAQSPIANFPPGVFAGRGALDGGVASTSVIQSITPGSCTIGASATTCTFTGLPTVNTSKTLLIWNGKNPNGADTNYKAYATRITLTNSTTVTATRENAAATTVTVYFTAIEFASGVNSIQYDSIAIAATTTSNTKALTNPTIGANSFIVWLGDSTATTVLDSATDTGVSVNTGTGVVTATLGLTNATNATNVNYVVADLDTTIVSAIQQGSSTASGGATAETATISSVTTTGTIIIYGGVIYATSSDVANSEFTQVLTNATTITYTRSGGGAGSRTHYYTTVTFAAAALNSNIQRGTIALSAATSNTAAISPTIVTAKSFANWGNFLSATGNANITQPNLVLTSSSVVTAAVNSAGSPTVSYEIVEFK